MVLLLPVRPGESLYGRGMDHSLVIDRERPHRSSCSCGVSLAPLLPHWPTTEDVTKAFLLHEMAEAVHNGG